MRVTAALRAAVAAAALGTAAAGAAGCAAEAGTGPPIQLATAYVPVPKTPGVTVAYVVIRNNGPADRLVSARTSAGGRVTFRVPVAPNGSRLRSVPGVLIPAHSTTAMTPNGFQMLISGARPLRGGRAITLTLVFAQAGPVSIVAQVTNPESGGASYFTN